MVLNGNIPDKNGNGTRKQQQLQISRPVLDLKEAHRVTGRKEFRKNTWRDLLKYRCHPKKPKSAKKLFNRYLPITDWLFNYNVRNDLMADIVAGITVAIMHIPQGMAYALLAGTAPIYGIYTAIFPVVIYTLLGPSRHVSMGTNPLTSILVGSAVAKYATSPTTPTSTTMTTPASTTISSFGLIDPIASREYSDLQVITAISLMAGLWQVAFSMLRLGKLSWLLSEVLVSGYTTAAAIHVLASQLKGLFGISLDTLSGPLSIFYTVIDLFERIEETNVASIIISVVCVLILVINDELLKPQVSKYCSFPVPIQLIVVVVGTMLSYFLHFQEKFDVPVVGTLPKGFPAPTVPDSSLFPKVLVTSLIVAIVGYSISLSMGKIYATKFNYKVDGNQELFSEGASNIFGSFFACIPSAASMSRSAVQVGVGGKTQLTSAVSILLLIIVILFAGPLFKALPKAILSAIIVVALKSMLLQFHELPRFYRQSKLDACLWVATFVAVIMLDIDLGLLVGIALALALLVYRSYHVRIEEVGAVGAGTGLFVEMGESDKAARVAGTVVLRLGGAISFANFDDVFDRLKKRIEEVPEADRKTIILDISGVPYVDQLGAKAIKTWLKEDKSSKRLLAAPTIKVERMLHGAEVDRSIVFVTVLDALLLHSSTEQAEVVVEELSKIGVGMLNGHSNGVAFFDPGFGQANKAFDELKEEK